VGIIAIIATVVASASAYRRGYFRRWLGRTQLEDAA
jgi:hypothetical protein